MSLYWPAEPGDVDLTAPRLHALVIGVGDYRHMGLSAARPARVVSGVAPLTTTTPSARRIAKWLETEYENPACPLGSIELLLSPGETLARADDTTVAIEVAAMDEIRTAFHAWYSRCHAGRDNIAFFYFAGHGISTMSHFLLAADFGDPDLPDEWAHCIDFTGMRMGMGKCNAQTQLYFVDACRDAPVSALVERNPHGAPLVTATFSDRVELSAAYFAASEGRQAYGRPGEETFFCKALLACFDGMAARKAGPGWRIDAASLSAALPSVLQTLSIVENVPLSCDCSVQKPVPVHFPPVGGLVLTSVDCDPATARGELAVQVTQSGEVFDSAAGQPRPWVGRLKPGRATFMVRFGSQPEEVFDDDVMPPTYELEVPR